MAEEKPARRRQSAADREAAEAVKTKQATVGGEGMVPAAEGMAAAEAGNAEVAETMEAITDAGYFGDMPEGTDNSQHTVEGHLAFLALDADAQRTHTLDALEASRAAQRPD